MTRTEKVIDQPVFGYVKINGVRVRVLITHYISEGGVPKNRVETPDGQVRIVLNGDIDFR